MSLITTIKEQFLQARKDRDEIATGILSVVLSEVQQQEGRAGQKTVLTDAQITKIIQKLISSNEEVLALTVAQVKLTRENEILQKLLPHNCTREEIAGMLGHVGDKIMMASGDGPATGIAMRALATFPGLKDGKLVAAVVKELRELRQV